MPLTVTVEVPPRDREVLASWVRSPSIRAGPARRARIVLLAADGAGTNELVRVTGVSKPTVIAWKKRYAAEGIGGLEDRPRPGRPRWTDDVAVVLATLEPPPEKLGVTHWSSRLLAAALGVSTVKRRGGWPGGWGSRTSRSRTCGGSTGCSRGGGRPSSSPPTLSSRRSSATSSASTSTRPDRHAHRASK